LEAVGKKKRMKRESSILNSEGRWWTISEQTVLLLEVNKVNKVNKVDEASTWGLIHLVLRLLRLLKRIVQKAVSPF
jgi:hypothetical protein